MVDRDKPRVVVRRIAVKPKAPPPRRAGQKVGLTLNDILAAALKVLATSPGPLTTKAVAAVLGVAHNSIGSHLRRERTTLEEALTKDVLSRIARPMGPQERWQSYLEALFVDTLEHCNSHPGLARCVTLLMAQDPTQCPVFTEGVLQALGSAGLTPSHAADQLDVVLATLCGMLAVRFPDFGGDPTTWAERVAQNLAGIEARRYPHLHPGAKTLEAMALDKVKRSARPPPFAITCSRLVIRHVETLTEAKNRKPKA